MSAGKDANFLPVLHRMIRMDRGENYWFDGCAAYVMEALGEKDFPYTLFAGVTGDALVQVCPTDRFRGNGLTDMTLSETGDGAFIEGIFAKCGYASRYAAANTLRVDADGCAREIMEHIDRGVPVIWQHWERPSWGVIVGYEDRGRILLYITEEKTAPERAALDEVLSEPTHGHMSASGLIFVGEKERAIDHASVYREAVLGIPTLFNTRTERLIYGAAAFRAKADELEGECFGSLTPEAIASAEYGAWGLYGGFICDLATNASCCYAFYNRALELNPDLTFINAVIEECRRMSDLWEGDGGLESLGMGIFAAPEALMDAGKRRVAAALLRECALCMDNIAEIVNSRLDTPISVPKRLRFCQKCSGLSADDFVNILAPGDYTTGCIGRCLGENPALAGKVYGYIDGVFTVLDTREAFLAEIRAAAQVSP